MENQETKKNKEIDVVALVLKVFQEWRTMLKFLVPAAIVGVVVAICTPKAYTSKVVLAPEMSGGGMGLSESLADMASSFGINLGSSGGQVDAIYPDLYPEILASPDFVKPLLDTPVRLRDDSAPRTYKHHLMLEQDIPFWQYPKIWLTKLTKKKENAPAGGGDGKPLPYVESREESELCMGVAKIVGCVVDKKTSMITISVVDQDPLVAAIMVDTIQHRLQDYITQYRTKKARADYDYYSTLLVEAKENYVIAQREFAKYADANRSVLLQSTIGKRDALENEVQTALGIMNQFQAQVQAANAKIQERTPAFTIIASPKMAYRASSMSRAMIVILFVFVGGLLDCLWVCFIRDFMSERKKNKQVDM